MPRYTKLISHDLIHYVKKLYVKANYFDPSATSAYEFARQMSSSQLRKVNPSYQFEFVEDQNMVEPAFLKVEFVNGKIWESQTGDRNCDDIRNEVSDRFDLFLCNHFVHLAVYDV